MCLCVHLFLFIVLMISELFRLEMHVIQFWGITISWMISPCFPYSLFSRISISWMLNILDSSPQSLTFLNHVVQPFIFLFYSLKDYLEFFIFYLINVLS